MFIIILIIQILLYEYIYYLKFLGIIFSLQPSNIDFLYSSSFIIHLDISGNDFNDRQL